MNLASRMTFLLTTICLLSACKTSQLRTGQLSYTARLQALFPKASISPIETADHFEEAYQVILPQYLDPEHPEAGTFEQYVYVSHRSYDSPTVLITDGYSSRNRTTELSKLLQANQIIVEFRMYGKSRPDTIPWEYLTNDLAVEDYHQIVRQFKKLYRGKWLASGISKGGETTLIYKSKYPKDFDVAVPYVAPLINGLEDQRTNDHINSVGSESCRKKIKDFQRAILKNRTVMLDLLDQYAAEHEMQFTAVAPEEALEYSVLEFPFSFWQWGGVCTEIPADTAEHAVLFDYLVKVAGFGLYNDRGFHYYLPSFYQHIRELGYYGFDLEPVENLLVVVKKSSNIRFAPQGVDLTYDENYIKRVRDYAEQKGHKTLYIYGAYDPWGACAPNPGPKVDALKMNLAGGDHSTRIKDFSPADQQKIYDRLQKWLGRKTVIYPL